MSVKAYRSQILHLLGDPGSSGVPDAVAYFADGLLVVEDGHVAELGDYAALAGKLPDDVEIIGFKNALITPGFIDTHIHFPQTDIIAAYGEKLLDWLNTYTYPAEAAYADKAYAREAADFFVAELLRNGTTSALVFATSHKASVDALFETALQANMRLISGKVLMDRNAPEDLCDGSDLGRSDTEELIRRWRGQGRLGYALTPRFAPTSTAAQLEMTRDILGANPDVWLQTHLSENEDEIRLTRALFPEAADYLDVYDRHGLLTDRSVFAHSLHLDDNAFERIARADAAISFCPTSNLFLGSGMFDLATAARAGVTVSLGTDVGGGTSFSLLQTMKAAYEVGQANDYSLDPFKSFYLATRGGAKALGLEDRIGHLSPGAEADFIVLDLAATPLIERRMKLANTIKEKLFILSILGDDRVISHTYLMGQQMHERGSVSGEMK